LRPTGITAKTWQRLSVKAKAFLLEYFKSGNAVKAYQDAGYVTGKDEVEEVRLRRRAYSVLKGRRVSDARLEHARHSEELEEARKQYQLDWIVSEHERLMKVAEIAGDLATATRNLELIGRTRGAYADVVQVDAGRRRDYTEAERIEARRIAGLLIQGEGTNPPSTPSPPSPQDDEGQLPRQEKSEESSEAEPESGAGGEGMTLVTCKVCGEIYPSDEYLSCPGHYHAAQVRVLAERGQDRGQDGDEEPGPQPVQLPDPAPVPDHDQEPVEPQVPVLVGEVEEDEPAPVLARAGESGYA